MRPRRRSVLTAASLLLLVGCSGNRRDNLLSGEWRLRLASRASRESPFQGAVSGALVFDSAIPIYGYGRIHPPRAAVIGRAYVDYQGTRIRLRESSIPFADGPDADLVEEVVAEVHPDSMVDVQIAPRIIGFDPVFRGRISGDTIRGTWTLFSHSETVDSGSFLMWRVARTAISDSAIVRARRAAQAWGVRPTDEDTSRADTARPVR